MMKPLKKSLCSFFAEGRCERGRNCGFAHGEGDIGKERYWKPHQTPDCINFLMGRPCPVELLPIMRSQQFDPTGVREESRIAKRWET